LFDWSRVKHDRKKVSLWNGGGVNAGALIWTDESIYATDWH